MSELRIVVTGIGFCAPLDFDGLIRGESGLVPAPDWGIPSASLRLGAVTTSVPDGVRALPGSWKPDRMDRVSHLGLLAAQAAREDAGLKGVDLTHAAVIVPSAMGGEHTHYSASAALREHQLCGGRFRMSPFTAPKLMPNAVSANVAILLGAHGPNVAPAAACASGAYAIAQAADQLRLGRAEIAFAGAAEAPCEEIAARAFLTGDALSPTGASLPFHRSRNGFVLAEGSAVLVLETENSARRRGARIYAELAGCGMTCDAYHVVAPCPDGTYASRAMKLALEEARLPADAVTYVNAHATGTAIGDLAEAHALRAVFGPNRPFVSSTKGVTGHLLGAAGALEAAFTVMAVAHNLVPTNIGNGCEELDPGCTESVNIVTGSPVSIAVPAAMSNSFAFGGHNASLVFRAWE